MNFISVHGYSAGYCRLEYRNFTLNICKDPPRRFLPVCVGFCPSITRWDFKFGQFVQRTSACTVTKYRIEQIVCPDATHTAVNILIPLKCSCSRHNCQDRHPHHP